MNSLSGNPHVHQGPQIADPDDVNEQFIAEEGITEHTMFLSELARNTEATLALAFEQRTANLIAWTSTPGMRPTEWMEKEIAGRLGLDGDDS